jgi:hypothetical protein
MGHMAMMSAAVFFLTAFLLLACGLIAQFRLQKINATEDSILQSSDPEKLADTRDQHQRATPACVSLYGHDPNLLAVRAQVIASGGFRTCVVHNDAELSRQMERACCSAVVLCYTLHDEEARQATLLAKSIRPTTKVVAMESFWSHTTLESADAIVGQFSGPAELVAAVKRLVLSA